MIFWFFYHTDVSVGDCQPNPLPFRIGTLFSLISWILHRFRCLGRRRAGGTYTINQNLPIYKTSGYRVLLLFTVIVRFASQNRPERWVEQLSSPHFNVKENEAQRHERLAQGHTAGMELEFEPWNLDSRSCDLLLLSTKTQGTGRSQKDSNMAPVTLRKSLSLSRPQYLVRKTRIRRTTM